MTAVSSLVRDGHLGAPSADGPAQRVKDAIQWYGADTDLLDPRAADVQQPVLARLLHDGIFIGPISLEDTQSPWRVHDALAPLRAAVYRRLGVSGAMEVLCSALEDPGLWAREALTPAARAPAERPSREPARLVRQVVLGWLEAHLPPLHVGALLAQVDLRAQYKGRKGPASLAQCYAEDAHAQAAFLNALEVFCLGERDLPPVWEVFDGPLFHWLAQHPEAWLQRCGRGTGARARRANHEGPALLPWRFGASQLVKAPTHV